VPEDPLLLGRSLTPHSSELYTRAIQGANVFQAESLCPLFVKAVDDDWLPRLLRIDPADQTAIL